MITNLYYVRNREALKRGSLVNLKVKPPKAKKHTRKGVHNGKTSST